MGSPPRARHSFLGAGTEGANSANAANVNSKTDGYSGSLTTDGGAADPDTLPSPDSLGERERSVLALFPYVPTASNG